jgi:PAS domain S-box-containing protein
MTAQNIGKRAHAASLMSTQPASALAAPELLTRLFDQTEDFALILMAPDRTITDWFPGASRIFGFSAQEMVGQSALRIFTPEDRQRGAADHEFAVAGASGSSEDERWHMRKDGTRFWGSGVLISIKQSSNEVIGFAKLVRNRTDLRTQTEALEHRIRKCAAGWETQRTSLATLAHELRSPLSSLTNSLAVLRLSSANDGNDQFRIIDRQINLLTRLISDAMESVRASAGRVSLKLEVADLRDIAQASFASVRLLAEAREHHFEILQIGGRLPIKCDPQRIDQVFVNLLNNAIKYTPRGGRITFSVSVEGNEAVARVEDNGIGMSADILPLVFDIFTREESAHTISPEGIGLGLALVRELVSLHGGTVQARSDGRDKGSMFVVRLPLLQTT